MQSLGRDQVLGFAPGNWIEIVDDALEFAGQPGELHQIDTIDFSARTITLTTNTERFLDRGRRSDAAHAHPPLGHVGQGVRTGWHYGLVGH